MMNRMLLYGVVVLYSVVQFYLVEYWFSSLLALSLHVVPVVLVYIGVNRVGYDDIKIKRFDFLTLFLVLIVQLHLRFYQVSFTGYISLSILEFIVLMVLPMVFYILLAGYMYRQTLKVDKTPNMNVSRQLVFYGSFTSFVVFVSIFAMNFLVMMVYR